MGRGAQNNNKLVKGSGNARGGEWVRALLISLVFSGVIDVAR